jgi:hypothetical protein
MREAAKRIFAGELNDTTLSIKGSGREPSYLVTPVGAKINRVCITGIITNIDAKGDEGDFITARIHDQTGIFRISAGKYQASAISVLQTIRAPACVMAIGKTRLFQPEKDVSIVFVRPEVIVEVNEYIKGYWTLEACKYLKKRLEILEEALKSNVQSAHNLEMLGCSHDFAQDLYDAIRHYGMVDITKYRLLIIDALREVTGLETAAQYLESSVLSDLEQTVLSTIKSASTERGVHWDTLKSICEKNNIDATMLDTILTVLKEKGYIKTEKELWFKVI